MNTEPTFSLYFLCKFCLQISMICFSRNSWYNIIEEWDTLIVPSIYVKQENVLAPRIGLQMSRHYSSCNVWIFRINFKMCTLQYSVLVSRNKMKAQIYVCQNNIAINMYAWSLWNNFTFSRFISHSKERATVNVYRILSKEKFHTSKIKEIFHVLHENISK